MLLSVAAYVQKRQFSFPTCEGFAYSVWSASQSFVREKWGEIDIKTDIERRKSGEKQ